MNTVFQLAGAEIELHDWGLVVSRYPSGAEVRALAEDDPRCVPLPTLERVRSYRAKAAEHGYGDDTAAMSRAHELTHHLLAHWLGLPCSPTLRAVAAGGHATCGAAEEAAVLAIQAFAQAVGVDLTEVAMRAGGAK